MQGSLFSSPAIWTQWEPWINHLTDALYYRPDQINLQDPRFLAVYRDTTRSLPFVLISMDASNQTPDGMREITHMARRQGFELVVLGSPKDAHTYQLGAYDGDYRLIPGLPTWMPRHPRNTLVRKEEVLLPFRTEEDVRAAFTVCHDALYKELAQDPAAAFDTLLLVLAAKVFDEQSDDPYYRFSVIHGELARDMRQRFLHLLDEAQNWLDNMAGTAQVTVSPSSLSDRLIKTLLNAFQDYSLSLSAKSIAGTDILGSAYESIVGSTFRGELGSYFTPRTIADFMARLLNIRGGRVLDPACGSGGLLLAVRRLSAAQPSPNGRNASKECGHERTLELYGNDINPRMVRAARLNFLLHGLEPRRILQGDGLQLDRMIRLWFGWTPNNGSGTWLSTIADGPFDAVLANPPFAGHEQDPVNLERTESAQRPDGTLRSVNRTIPFLESILASLKIGGVAGVVIPTSILNAEEDSFVKLREVIREHAEILAIIGLPEWAFLHTGCGIHGALLFLKRVNNSRSDYSIFVDWASNLGYDRLGRYTRANDFPAILERYQSKPWPSENTFMLSELVEHNRFDPAWLKVLRSLPQPDETQSGDFIRLTEIMQVRNARVPRKLIRDDQTYRYFEVADADMHTGEVKTVHEATGFELRKKPRIKHLVQTGDILLPNHRDSLIAKATASGRSVVIIGPELDGVLTTDRFIVLRSRVHPLLTRLILNSAGVRRQIVAQCRGAASLDIRERTLSSVWIPRRLVEKPYADEIINKALEVNAMQAQLEEKLRVLSETIESAFETAPRKAQT